MGAIGNNMSRWTIPTPDQHSGITWESVAVMEEVLFARLLKDNPIIGYPLYRSGSRCWPAPSKEFLDNHPEFKQPTKPKNKETKMAKVGVSMGQGKGPIGQHKALAEGKKVTGEKLVMKKGGEVKKKEMKKKK